VARLELTLLRSVVQALRGPPRPPPFSADS
jgi:hypothetical protein